jgi:hypothetical protein
LHFFDLFQDSIGDSFQPATMADDAELALRLHLELNGLVRGRPSASKVPRKSGADTPQNELGNKVATPFKKPRLVLSNKDIDNQVACKAASQEDDQKQSEGEVVQALESQMVLASFATECFGVSKAEVESKSWLSRKQRSPIPRGRHLGCIKCDPNRLTMNHLGQASASTPDASQSAGNGMGFKNRYVALDPEQEAAVKVRETLAIYNHERLIQVDKEAERVKRRLRGQAARFEDLGFDAGTQATSTCWNEGDWTLSRVSDISFVSPAVLKPGNVICEPFS